MNKSAQNFYKISFPGNVISYVVRMSSEKIWIFVVIEKFAKIQKRIVEAIQQVAKDNNYDAVLNKGVINASSKADISGLVIEYLKKVLNGASE